MSPTPRPRLPGRRLQAKAATRAKVLDAAEAMFNTRGWEATTIRDVAAAAEVSTGAIFSSFADKAALFHAVLERDLDLLHRKMTAAAEAEAPLRDSLLSIFMCGYQHYDPKLPFLRAMQHVIWSEDGARGRELLASTPFVPLLESRLRIAALWKEIKDMRLNVRARMLADSYLANYPHALYGAWDLGLLRRRSRAQIQVILAGVLPTL